MCEFLALLRCQGISKRGIDAHHAAAITVGRVFTAPDLKAVQMLILPTEGDWQCLMELSDGAIASHQ